MASSSRPCPSCGARVPADSDRCDLCGVSLTDETEPGNSEPENSEPGNPEPSKTEPQNTDPDTTESSKTEAEDAGETVSTTEEPVADEERGPAAESVFCNQCGHENPAGANFCSQCGATLDASAVPEGTRPVAAELPRGGAGNSTRKPTGKPTGKATGKATGSKEATTSEDEEQQLMSQQLLLTVGVALLVVIGLFFITLWSQNQTWSTNTEPADGAETEQPVGTNAAGGPVAGNAAPGSGTRFGGQDIGTLIEQNGVDLPETVQQRADSLEQQMDNVDGNVKRTLQEQLVNVYVGADAFGRASRLQQEMADASGNAADWRRTGDLFYNWMEYVGRESNGRNPAIAPIGRRAIAAYENVLESEPENHDVRTDMATVLLRSNDPMRGVEELKRVLESDSTFVPARFNKGIALLWIGRYEQAITEFEAVQDLAGEDSPRYDQAARAIELVREEMNAQGSPANSAQPPVAPAG